MAHPETHRLDPRASRQLERQPFEKHRRLLKRKDFLRVQASGSGAGTRHFVVIAAPHPDGADAPSRLGIVASKRAGNAVVRNRGKRLVRTWFRTRYQEHRGIDAVVVLRAGAAELGADEVGRELDNGIRRAIKKAMRGTTA